MGGYSNGSEAHSKIGTTVPGTQNGASFMKQYSHVFWIQVKRALTWEGKQSYIDVVTTTLLFNSA